MKKFTSIIFPAILLLISSLVSSLAQQSVYQDDELTPIDFGTILKNEWIFLRDATDQLLKDTEKRGEFETTPEFQARVIRTRQQYVESINNHIKEAKLSKRIFSVWFKATLESYNADAGIYSLTCASTAEAPYDIPSVECSIPLNPYVDIADSIRGGYRTSTIFLKFQPDFQWSVARTEAQAAKNSEQQIFFRLRFVLDISQDNISAKAKFKIIPKEIALMHLQNKFIYWKDEIKP
jgi:hypothetical protein